MKYHIVTEILEEVSNWIPTPKRVNAIHSNILYTLSVINPRAYIDVCVIKDMG